MVEIILELFHPVSFLGNRETIPVTERCSVHVLSSRRHGRRVTFVAPPQVADPLHAIGRITGR